MWLFIGIGIVSPIVLIVVLYRFTEPIYVAAFLGAWPVSAIAFYDHFVNVSLVTFDKRSIWKDSLQVMDRQGVTWHFLRLPVKNSGFAPARNCTAELRVLRRPQKNGESCPAPSYETKALKWSPKNPKESHTIPARRGTAIIDVLIDDTSVASTARCSWHEANNWGPLTLWAGTHEVFYMSPAKRAQDAFCQGDYEIEVTVFPENGAPKSETFRLHVDKDWNSTSLGPFRNATEVKKLNEEEQKSLHEIEICQSTWSMQNALLQAYRGVSAALGAFLLGTGMGMLSSSGKTGPFWIVFASGIVVALFWMVVCIRRSDIANMWSREVIARGKGKLVIKDEKTKQILNAKGISIDSPYEYEDTKPSFWLSGFLNWGVPLMLIIVWVVGTLLISPQK